MFKFIGFSHIKGTSKKTGNEYDSYILNFITDVDPDVIGFSAFNEMVAVDNLSAVTGFDEKALRTKVDLECHLEYIKSGNYNKLCKVRF